ncbi:MAG: exodeoxyribonuclease III, partial [Bdellovibrionota bacterium]
LQETKISPGDLEDDENLVHPSGYHSHWAFAMKPGYSGVTIFSRKDPVAVRLGLGLDDYDREGRWLEADFNRADFSPGSKGEITVISSYWPNSQRDHARLPFKLDFCRAAERRLQELKSLGKHVFICGDFNIAHKEIDLANPKSNMDNAGFLPEERAWMDRFLGELGWVDTFREFEKGPGHYTWWSYRPGVREKNVGWRLDYFFCHAGSRDMIASVRHRPDVKGSDHCPVLLTLKD